MGEFWFSGVIIYKQDFQVLYISNNKWKGKMFYY